MTNNPLEYFTCFISYSSKDSKFAEQLNADLRKQGVRCWFAPEDMRIGDKFRETIDRTIIGYDKVLLIISRHSINSEWVEKEVETAFEEERKRKMIILFPIRVDQDVMNCDKAWAADIRRTRHIGDFTDWKDDAFYQNALNKLIRGPDPLTNFSMEIEPKNSPFAKTLAAWPGGAAAGGDRPGRGGGRRACLGPGASASGGPGGVAVAGGGAVFGGRSPRRPTALPGSISGGPSACTRPFICPTSATPTASTAVSRSTPGSRGEKRTLTPAEIRDASAPSWPATGFSACCCSPARPPRPRRCRIWLRPWPSPGKYSPLGGRGGLRLGPERNIAFWWSRGLEGVTLYMETYHRETYGPRCTAGAANGIMTTAWRPSPGPAGPGAASSVWARCWAFFTGGPTAFGWACTPATSRRSAGRAPYRCLSPRAAPCAGTLPGRASPRRPGVGAVDAGPEDFSAGGGL